MRVMLMTLCLFIATSAYSQPKSSNENSLLITTGIGLRITPVDLSDYELRPSLPFYIQRDQQISGPAVYLGLLYYWTKSRISFEYANSFRYHDFYLNYGDDITNHRYILTSDFHFTLNKFFPLRKNTLKTGLGYSFLNRGSNFVYRHAEVTPGGDTISYSRVGSLNFSTFNLSVGYQINQLSFELINRVTDHKFPESGVMYIPELRVSYGLRLKNGKIF